MSRTHRSPTPRTPFSGWPEGLPFGDGAGTVWFLPDAILCVQMHCARVDLRVARAYLDTLRRLREAERAAIAEAGGLRIYQDFRSLQVIDREARAYFVAEARADFGRWSLVSNKIELTPSNPIVRMTIQLVSKAMTQIGLPVFVLCDDLASELERDGVLREPAPVRRDSRCSD